MYVLYTSIQITTNNKASQINKLPTYTFILPGILMPPLGHLIELLLSIRCYSYSSAYCQKIVLEWIGLEWNGLTRFMPKRSYSLEIMFLTSLCCVHISIIGFKCKFCFLASCPRPSHHLCPLHLEKDTHSEF